MRKKTDPEYTNVIKIFDEFYSLTIEVLLYRNRCENENNSGKLPLAI